MPFHHMISGFHHNLHQFFGLGMGLIWLIIIIFLAYFIYRLTKEDILLNPLEKSSKSSKDILDERYAKGELTREQFIQMRKDLDKEQL